MNEWRVGDLKVTKVLENEDLWKGHIIAKDMTAENVLKEADWLLPRFANEEGRIRISFHSLIVESGGLRILIDTCVGNDKQREFPRWNLQHWPYLADLAKAGYPRESIDRVICTHLHVDHVGWNTMMHDGRWVPTFPNARYLLSRREWEHWSQSKEKRDPATHGRLGQAGHRRRTGGLDRRRPSGHQRDFHRVHSRSQPRAHGGAHPLAWP